MNLLEIIMKLGVFMLYDTNQCIYLLIERILTVYERHYYRG